MSRSELSAPIPTRFALPVLAKIDDYIKMRGGKHNRSEIIRMAVDDFVKSIFILDSWKLEFCRIFDVNYAKLESILALPDLESSFGHLMNVQPKFNAVILGDIAKLTFTDDQRIYRCTYSVTLSASDFLRFFTSEVAYEINKEYS